MTYRALISPDTNGWQVEVWAGTDQIGYTNAGEYETVEKEALRFLEEEGFDVDEVEVQFV